MVPEYKWVPILYKNKGIDDKKNSIYLILWSRIAGLINDLVSSLSWHSDKRFGVVSYGLTLLHSHATQSQLFDAFYLKSDGNSFTRALEQWS